MDRQQTARRGMLVALIVLGVLVVDQLIKIWVKTNMTLHEQIEILSWFKIVFIENNGMAYGMEIGSKLVLSLFRVVAISILGYYMVGLVKRQSRWGYLVCLSMILAGAVGNMLDSMFYGLIFNASSEFYTSYFVPFGTGYAPFLMGKVVDMFYFPLDCYYMARLGTRSGWQSLCVLQSGIQLCRRFHLGGCRHLAAVLS